MKRTRPRRALQPPTPVSLALLTLVLVLGLASPPPATAAEPTVEVLHVDHRTAEEMLPMVEPLLSPDGRASADARTNSLVIFDTPDRIESIRRFLAGADRPGQPVTVRVRFSESRLASGAGVAATGGARVRARAGNRSREGRSEYFIRVMSGSSAYIWAGKEIPYTQRWIDLCRRYGRWVETVQFQRIESGFDVRPTVTGSGRVHVVVTPRITLQEGGRRQRIVRFAAAATTLSVARGQWVSIGATGSSSHEVTREILASGARRRDAALNIELRVE